jgi:hypothetical protein
LDSNRPTTPSQQELGPKSCSPLFDVLWWLSWMDASPQWRCSKSSSNQPTSTTGGEEERSTRRVPVKAVPPSASSSFGERDMKSYILLPVKMPENERRFNFQHRLAVCK